MWDLLRRLGDAQTAVLVHCVRLSQRLVVCGANANAVSDVAAALPMLSFPRTRTPTAETDAALAPFVLGQSKFLSPLLNDPSVRILGTDNMEMMRRDDIFDALLDVQEGSVTVAPQCDFEYSPLHKEFVASALGCSKEAFAEEMQRAGERLLEQGLYVHVADRSVRTIDRKALREKGLSEKSELFVVQLARTEGFTVVDAPQ